MTHETRLENAIPLSLYIHLPWCVRKCPYCDFNSHEFNGAVPEREYIAALVRDIEFAAPCVAGREIDSIFFGGGTPSLFSGQAIGTVLNGVNKHLHLSSDAEITLEANPGTVEAGRFRGYRRAGVNRISLGVQSFDNEQLKKLGRIHEADEALDAIRTAKGSGFDNINIDLMFGLPGQTPFAAMADLNTAFAAAPAHISWYQLTIEPNTRFYKFPPELPEDQILWEIQQAGQALLAENGFRQYEVSAYARPGYQCRHNLNYWRFGDYLGIGAGAHSKITSEADFSIQRSRRHRMPASYMQHAGTQAAITGERILQREEVILEFMMNALRLNEGFETSLFTHHAGLSVDAVRTQLDKASEGGMLEIGADRIKPTQRGMQYLNTLLENF